MLTKVIKLRMEPDEEQAQALAQTMERYREACNLVSQHIFDNGCFLVKQDAHGALYRRLCGEFELTAYDSIQKRSCTKRAASLHVSLDEGCIRRIFS